MAEYVVLNADEIPKENMPSFVNLANHLPGASLLRGSIKTQDEGNYIAQITARIGYQEEAMERLLNSGYAGKVSLVNENKPTHDYNIFD